MMMMTVLRGIDLGKDRREARVSLQLGGAQLLAKCLALLMQRLELVRCSLVGNESLELFFKLVLLRFQAGIGGKHLLLCALQLGPFGIGQDGLLMLMAGCACFRIGISERCRGTGETKRECCECNSMKGEWKFHTLH